MSEANVAKLRKRKHAVLGLLLSLALLIGIVPFSVLAVTGDDVAADGTYKANSSGSSYSYNIVVKEGKVSALENVGIKDKYADLLTKYATKLVGTTASYNAIDTVSAATTSKKYGPALKTEALNAIKAAPSANENATKYTVTYVLGNGQSDNQVQVTEGSTAAKPENPTYSGYVFQGWYTDAAGTNAYDFNTAVTKDLTLYAVWKSSSVNMDDLLADGRYFDDTVEVEEYGYDISVTLTVANGKIVGVTADATGAKKKNAKRLKSAIEGIRNQLIGKEATGNTIASVDTVSGATYSSEDIIESLLNAIAGGATSGNTVTSKVVADGTYINSSATTYEEVYNPVVTVEVSGGKVVSVETSAPGIRPYSAEMLKEATEKIRSDLVGQDATQANVSAIDVDSVSGATHSMKAVTEAIYASFAGETGASTARQSIADDGLTLSQDLTDNGNGTYTLTISGKATQEGSSTELYIENSSSSYSKSNLDSGNYYYNYQGQMYVTGCGTYTATSSKKTKTYYYGFFTAPDGVHYLTRDGITSSQPSSSNNIGNDSSSSVLKKSVTPLYNKTTSYSEPGTYYTALGSGKSYRYKDFDDVEYYYYYNGNYYPITYDKNGTGSTEYTVYFTINGTKYYLDGSSATTTETGSSEKKDTCFTSTATNQIYSNPITVLGVTTGTGNTYDSNAVLTEEINLNVFDVSNATYTVSGNGNTLQGSTKVPYVEAKQDDGVVVRSSILNFTGYDYTANLNQPLTMTISGLKLADGAAGPYLSAGIGNAEIYATANSKNPAVASVSPLFAINASPTYTVSYDLDGGEGDFPDQTDVCAGMKVYLTDESPEKENYAFKEWKTSPQVTLSRDENGTAYFIMPAEPVHFTALWKTTATSVVPDGIYGDYSVLVTDDTESINYTPIVSIVVKDGVIQSLLVDADEATSSNQKFLNKATASAESNIVGKPASESTIAGIDSVSRATLSSNAIRESLQKALAAGAKDPYTVSWTDGAGVETKYTNVTYGTRTATVQPEDPTKANATFTGWSPEVAIFVTEDAAYVPVFEGEEETYGQVSGCSLTLNGYIWVNFYMVLPEDYVSDSGAYATINDVTIEPVKQSDGRYKYTYKKLCTPEMRDTVTLKLYYGNGSLLPVKASSGTFYTDGYPYSAQKYFDTVKKLDPAKYTSLQSLVERMSDFGKFAQIQFNHNADAGALTPEAEKLLSGVTVDTLSSFKGRITNSSEAIKHATSSLTLNEGTNINHYFTISEGYSVDDFDFKVNGKSVTPQKSGTRYRVVIESIPAAELDDVYTVQVFDKSGNLLVNVENYSALSYAYAVVNASTMSENMKNLVKAMYLYNQQAKTYFNK